MARVHYVLAALAALAVLFIAAEAGTMTGTRTLNNKASSQSSNGFHFDLFLKRELPIVGWRSRAAVQSVCRPVRQELRLGGVRREAQDLQGTHALPLQPRCKKQN